MTQNLLYIDSCEEEMIDKIKKELGLDVALRLPKDKWNVNDAMGIITIPNIKLAIINTIDEIAVMEMTLLHFMCKPILITTKSIKNYKVLEKSVVDYIEPNCNLSDVHNNFFSWYRTMFRRTNG